MEPSRWERQEGGLLGLMVGDAAGVPYEFHPPSSLPSWGELDMQPPVGFARSHAQVPPGTWSDDGAQALCLLESLLTLGHLDVIDFAERMVAWLTRGHLAVDGVVFDVGVQTTKALRFVEQGWDPLKTGGRGEFDNGNGSLMRVLPLALWHEGSDAELIDDAMEQSLPTHAHLRARVCCALYCLWAREELSAEPEAFERALASLKLHATQPMLEELEVITEVQPPKGTGYVVDCLRSARWALEQATYKDVVKAAISLGNDTDTTAAVAGGIAGIRFGARGIPLAWRARLRGRELLQPLIEAWKAL